MKDSKRNKKKKAVCDFGEDVHTCSVITEGLYQYQLWQTEAPKPGGEHLTNRDRADSCRVFDAPAPFPHSPQLISQTCPFAL